METTTQSVPPVTLARLVQRLFSARAHMAPHQRERDNGKLILDCCEVVGGAVLSITHLEACLENGAKIKKQDGQWHIFAADGNGIKRRDTLSELLTDIPPLNAKCDGTAASGCPDTTCSSFCHPAEKCCINKDGKCDALREVARSVAGHIRKPYSAGEIATIIESGDYSAEIMMQHLLILVTNEKASDGGPLTPKLKQDANPPFAAPPC